jgi:O-acetyl-ADP-ribose deacetylase (regulator of RNase III)
MKTSVRETTLEIVPGDIFEMDVDAIVTIAAETQAEHPGAGGQSPVAAGEATIAQGTGKAKWIVRAALEGSGARTSADVVARATRRALEVADAAGARTLALPLLTAAGFPLYAGASVMTGEVRRYVEEHRRTRITRIVFAAQGEADKAAFKNALAGLSRFQP